MIHLFVDASAASAGSGPTYVRNVVPHLAAVSDLHSTVLVSPLLRHEFQDKSNVSFLELADESISPATRFVRTQRLVPELIRRSGANVLLSAGNIALFRSPVPQILLSGNALYTSADFFRDLRLRGDYRLWLDTRIKGQMAKWSVQAADCTVAPSQAFADEIERWTGVHAQVIHHGFDRNLFFRDTEPLPAELKKKLERTSDELRLLFVSHYNYYRNFETLIRAVSAAAQINPPPAREAVSHLPARTGCQSRIVPDGSRRDRRARTGTQLESGRTRGSAVSPSAPRVSSVRSLRHARLRGDLCSPIGRSHGGGPARACLRSASASRSVRGCCALFPEVFTGSTGRNRMPGSPVLRTVREDGRAGS